MPRSSQDLDLILETRLDVLAQAVEEVRDVIKAMAEQSDRLDEVEEFLSDEGSLSQAEGDLLQHVGDVATRLNVLLRPPPRPVPTGPQLMKSGRPQPLPESDRQRRLHEVLERAESAKKAVDNLAAERGKAYSSFQDVRRWSVAGLVDTALEEALQDYQSLIREIRRDKSPWGRYQAEMPRRGHELFTHYLELLAGMAVRGFGLDATVVSDVDALIGQLMGPEPRQGKPTEQQRSPLALMSSLGGRHMPLGYPEWSLWALPLVGRSAGELVVASLLPGNVDSRLRVICTDLYAQYVLGPSYLHAAIFLEFDPSADPPTSEAPSDALRATLLLQKLRDWGDKDEAYRQLVRDIAAPVEKEWRRAREAVGGEEPTLDPEDHKVVNGFLMDLAREFPEIAYPVDYMADLADAGRELTVAVDPDGNEARVRSMQLRNLMSAMWLARLKNPSKARLIHKRAREVAQRGQGGAPNRPGRGTQARVTWA